MKEIKSIKDSPQYDHYHLTAYCADLESGIIECHTPKGQPRLTLYDFYRSHSPLPEYDEKLKQTVFPAEMPKPKKVYQLKPTS